MNEDARFDGSIPATYDEYLGAFVFEPYAKDLAARVARCAPQAVLETAAGTGVVTRALAEALPSGVRIVCTDLNEAMLRVASRRPGVSAVTFQQADAQTLPFGDETFDVVACQFGMMFPPDKHAAHREARRVLRPGGRFLFSVWGSLEANEASAVVGRAVAASFPHDPPTFFERTPFGYHDSAVLRGHLGAAGFRDVVIEGVEKVTTASAEKAAIGLCKGTPLRSEIEARAPERLDEITAAATKALVARFGATVENRMLAYVVEATR